MDTIIRSGGTPVKRVTWNVLHNALERFVTMQQLVTVQHVHTTYPLLVTDCLVHSQTCSRFYIYLCKDLDNSSNEKQIISIKLCYGLFSIFQFLLIFSQSEHHTIHKNLEMAFEESTRPAMKRIGQTSDTSFHRLKQTMIGTGEPR